MGTVVIEMEGMLEFSEQEGGYAQSAIGIGGKWLCTLIAKRLELPLVRDWAAPDGPVGHCKLRLEIERP